MKRLHGGTGGSGVAGVLGARPRRRWLAVVVLAAGVGVPVTAMATHGYDADAPCPNRNTGLKTEDNPYGVLPATGPFGYDTPGLAYDWEAPDVVHPDVVAPSEAEGRTIRCVHVGGGDLYKKANPGLGNFALTRFYPDTIQVHRGDIIEFRPAPGWAGTSHAPGIFGHPPEHADPLRAAVGLVRTDEIPGVIAFDDELATGSGLGDAKCGLKRGSRSHGVLPQKPCAIRSVPDGSRFDFNEALTNVGRPQPFWVEISLPEGVYQYHCTYHSWMIGRIEVVGDKTKVPDHDEVAESALDMATEDIAEAAELHRELSEPQWRQDGDDRVWRVTTGANTDSGHATIIGYMPAALPVRRGDRVEFVGGRPEAPTVVGQTAEAQTVTFPGEAVGRFFLNGCTMEHCDGTTWIDDLGPPPGQYKDGRLHTQAVPTGLTLLVFPWACDYDGWKTGLPGVPNTWVPRTGCPPGPDGERGNFEFSFSDLAARSQRAPLDEIRTKETVHNSGWMVPAAYSWPERPLEDPTWKDDPTWPTTFEARFPTSGVFTYGCLLHPDVMSGSISVGDR